MCDDRLQSVESVLEPRDHRMVVGIRSGDVLVIHTEKRVNADFKQRLTDQLAETAPGAQVLVVEDGALMTHVLRPE